MSLVKPLIDAALSLSAEVKALQFAEPTAYIYNPLEYAWEIHKHYLELAGQSQKEGGFSGYEPRTFWDGPDWSSLWRNSGSKRLDGFAG